ncbi:MAG: RagB/SusD family nutrient uptake outer membrane protein [Bacteroidia bacterium]|nr:RagB/SusD family nutrient uptake outer membrane protein [Bacteroidia bacterium]
MHISYKTLLLVLAMGMITTGCEKEFLQRNPKVGVTEANFYKNADDAVAAVNAAYSALQYEITPSGHFRWFWGDIVSDDATKGGSGDNDVASLGRLEVFDGRPTNELLESEWNADYKGIYFANLVIKNVPPIEMDPFLKAQIVGEAKFIRAWFYYNLAMIFGDVPLVTEVVGPDDVRPRTPVAEIWAQVETDLQEAISTLPLRSELSQAEIGRITRGAAQALLVKVYAFQSKWTDAEPVADAIIQSQEYALENNYRNIFTIVGENGQESIFEIQYMNRSNGDWGRFEEGTLTNVFQRARGDFGGYGFNIPTQSFVDEFFKEGFEDPRLSATVFREGEPMGDRGIFTKDATGGYPYDYYAKKYFISKNEEAPTGDANVNGQSNDRVIRYADILLLHAEAAYHNGNEGAARISLNEVRARARGNTSLLPDVTASGQALLDAILHERRVELGLEGHRFFDVIRQGKAYAESVMKPMHPAFNYDVHKVFPIPQSQIQLSDGVITQNTGY